MGPAVGTIVTPLMGDYFADTDPQPGWTWLRISLPPKTSDREGGGLGGGGGRGAATVPDQSPTSPRPVPDTVPDTVPDGNLQCLVDLGLKF